MATAEETPTSWADALSRIFPTYTTSGFAPHHEAFWQWVWALGRGLRPPPFIAVWPRGGAKSTSVEMAVALVAARSARRYGLYVCATQDQADDHVGNVAGMLESTAFGTLYPDASSRAMGKYGNSKGWRRNRIRTHSGFTLDALGLDTAARGAKLDEDRPDLIIFDDIDAEDDTGDAVDKKIASITKKLIPAGSPDVAFLGVQNLVQPDGIFARLVDGRADFLHNRIVSGPFPALRNMTYVARPDGGHQIIHVPEDAKHTGQSIPTWEGQDVARCQAMVDDMGLRAFLAECQHEVENPVGLVLGEDFDGVRIYDPGRNVKPPRIAWKQCKWRIVGIDPGGRDPTAMVAVGIDREERHHLYAMRSRPGPVDPTELNDWLSRINEAGRIDAIVMDSSDSAGQLGTIMSTLARMGWVTYPANRGNALGISHLRMLFKTGRLTIPEAFREELESEIKAWMFPKHKEGQGKSGQWETIVRATNHHADRLKALQYACVAVLDGYPPGESGPAVVSAAASGVVSAGSVGVRVR